MIFTLTFAPNLGSLLMDVAPLFLGLGVIVAALFVTIGKPEGWSIGDSLYYGFITATSVGYGDLTPTCRSGSSSQYSLRSSHCSSWVSSFRSQLRPTMSPTRS